jgi:hypothetical protein
MLDLIAPIDQRGRVQGTYTTFLNVGNAIAPWVLGLLADGTSTQIALWTGVGISFLASIINAPLIKKKGMGPVPKKVIDEEATIDFDEEEMLERALKGDYVPARIRHAMNHKRMDKGEQFILVHAGTFENDEPHLKCLRSQAKEDMTFLRGRARTTLAKLNNPEQANEVEERLQFFNDSYSQVDQQEVELVSKELAEWFTKYLKYNGYKGLVSPTVIKMMLLKAFPVLTHDEDLTTENMEETLINADRIYSQFLRLEDEKARGYTSSNILKEPIRRFWG